MRSIWIAAGAALALGAADVRAQKPAGAEPVVVSPPQKAPVAEVPPGAAQPNPAQTGEEPERFDLRPELFGYVKLGYFLVIPPGTDALVGSNSGFRLVNARVGVSLRPVESIQAVVSVDGSVSRREETDPLEGSRVVELRDAYLQWDASRFARLRGGQFKAPFNAEVLMPDDALPFVTRSIVSEGLLPPEGFRVQGLALDRQVGVQLSSERLGGDVHFQYALAVVNGNGANVLNNDNSRVAPVARVQAGFKDLVVVGANVFQNSALIGVRPNRIAQDQLAYGADLTVNFGGFSLLGMYVQRNVSYGADTGLPSDRASGVVGSARYLLDSLGLEGGLRVASYEPSAAIAGDRQLELTAMVGYRPRAVPARILLQFTMRGEEPNASIGNDSVDLLAQVTF